MPVSSTKLKQILVAASALGVLVLANAACPRFAEDQSADLATASGSDDSTSDGQPTICGDAPLAEGFVCVAAGPYIHGCSTDCVSRPDWFPEGTAYPVWAPHFAELDPALELGAFQIMEHEITVGEYAACIDAGRCPMPSCFDSSGSWPAEPGEENYAASCLGPSHASEFCAWQGEQLGLVGSLPTECQWEKAARGDVDARNFPSGFEPPGCEDAHIGLFSSEGAPPCTGESGPGVVGMFPEDVSPYGVFDLMGNVAEWTRSRMQCGQGDLVRKGGAWTTGPAHIITARLDFRYVAADDDGVPGSVDSTHGARCVLGPLPEVADEECPPAMEDQSVCTDPALEALRCEEHHDGTGGGAGIHFDVERTIHVVVSSVDGDGLESITLQNSVGLPEVQLIGAAGPTVHLFPGPVKLHICSREPGGGGSCDSTPGYDKGLATFETPSGNRIELEITCPVE